MRTSGTWTTYAGEQRQVAGRVDGPVLRLRDRTDPTRLAEEVPVEDVGEVLQVSVRARWRDGSVVVNRMQGEDHVIFLTDDTALAEREGLAGDHYSGWGGVAHVRDLGNVEETVKVLREAGGHG